MTSIADKLSNTIGQIFEDTGLPADLGRVQVSDRPDLAQFQCNGAMAAAKIAKKAPRDIANDILGKLQNSGDFSKVEIAGPGFINLNVTDDYLAAHLKNVAADERLGVQNLSDGETMILDYGGPNIAKPMHVGHLRSSLIGDALYRTAKFLGYNAYSDVHMGDWGTHMGMIISEYIKIGKADEILALDLNDPEAVQNLMDDLSATYPRVSGECNENPDRKEEARQATLKLQHKEQPYYGLWEQIKAVSVKSMKANFASLGVEFDLWKGEADVHDYIAPMVDDMKQKAITEESEGALVIHVDEEDDKKEIPPLILYKRDGAVMYGTTDLATIVERVKLYDPAKVIYIVDQRQNLHFLQVFRSARKAGLVKDDLELFFAGFGTMNGPDGKPFKTRAGGVMKLEELIAMAIDKARQRLDEAELAKDMDEDERADVAYKVALAAIKFADLQNQRQTDYIFDLDRLISFEGKTGPYMLYQAVRIKSLLKKAADQGFTPTSDFNLEDVDRPLALLLSEMPDMFAVTLRNYAPHNLCDYAYKLAQEFSRFYAACHILSEENEALRESRLGLAELTYRQLECVLGCLGITVPDRM